MLDTVAPVAPTGMSVSPSTYNAASTTLTVSGTTESSTDTVNVTLTGQSGSPVTKAATVGALGAFSAAFTKAQVTTLGDGTLSATAKSTDRALNVGPASAAVTATKDTVVPTLVSTVPTAGGKAKSSGFTYIVTGSESLSPSPSSHIDLFDTGTGDQLASNTVVSGSTATMTPTDALSEKTYSAHIFLIDVAGNPAVETDNLFTIDNTAPAAPAVSAPVAVTVANKAAHPVSGTGEAGATINLTATSGATSVPSSTTVGAGGTWSLNENATTLTDGTVSYTATQTDGAGNLSLSSAPVTTTKDVVAPHMGPLSANPNPYAGHTLVTVTGTVDNGAMTPVAEADSVTVAIDDTSASTPSAFGTATATGGAFSIAVDTRDLGDGTLTISATATDGVGNLSNVATKTVTKDTGLPMTPTVAISPKPINNTNKGAITISGTTEAGASVAVSVADSVAMSTPVTSSTTANGSGAYTVTVNTDTPTTLADGTITVSVVATDAAGNNSITGTATTTKDTGVPTAPTNLVVPAYVTGTTVTITGDAEAASTINGTAKDAGNAHTQPFTATVDGMGHWTATVPVTALNDGTITYSVTATDASGNVSPAATTTNVKDTVAPGQAATLSGTPNPYTYTNATATTAFTVSGTTAAANTGDTGMTADVTIADSDGVTANLSYLGVPVTSGAFSKAVSSTDISTLTDGTLTITVVLHDAAGNTSPSRTANAELDLTMLTLSSTSPTTGSTVQAPATTSATYNEVLAAGSAISVKNKNNASIGGTKSIASKTITFTPGSPFTEAGSPYTVTVNAVDSRDSGDLKTSTYTFTVDATAPVVPTITTITNPVNSANQNAVSVSGNATEVGVTVTVTIGSVTGSAVSAAGGTYTVTGLDVTSLADGTLSATAASTDVAGNMSASSAPTTTLKDTTAPVVTALAATGSNSATPSTTITGSVSEASSVVFTATDGTTTVTSTVSEPAGSFTKTLNVGGLTDGLFTVTATPTDTVGNPGALVMTTATKDTVAPAVNPLTATSTNIATPSTTVTGTRSEASSVALSATDGTHTVTGSVANGLGSFTTTLDLSTLTDGGVVVSATPTDVAGNAGAAKTASITKDATAPVITGFGATSTTIGSPSSSITGTRSEVSTIALSATDGTNTVTGSVTSGTGAFTKALNISTLADGPISITATPTDAAGNPGAASTAMVGKDAVAPVVTGLAATNTNLATPSTTITGTRSETSTLALSATDGVTTVTATVASGTGAFSMTRNLTTLADGVITVTATPTDSAGNPGTPVTTTLTKDATAPVLTGITATGTNIATPSTTVAGTRSETSVLAVSISDGTHTVTANVASGTGAFSQAVNLAPLTDGVFTVTVTPTDTAGNPGADGTATAAKDSAAPVVSALAATGVNVASPASTISGTRSESSSVAISATDGTHTVTSAVASGSGAFSVSVSFASLTDGPISVSAVPTDVAGNPGAPASAPTSKDSVAPVLSAFTASNTTSNSPSSTVTGTRSETSTVALTATDGTTTVTGSVPSGTGAFSTSLDLSSLTDGALTVTATATDSAGNVGTPVTRTVAKDATLPVITGLAATSPNGLSNATTVTGTRSETSTVALTATDGTHTVTGSVASGTAGFSASLNVATLTSGAITVTARATDTVGNVGAPVSTTATYDSIAPTVTGLAATVVNSSTPSTTVTGTRSETSTVALSASDGTTTVTGAVPSGTGAFSATLNLSTLTDGPVTVTAVPTDAAGNVGSSASGSTRKDTTAPTVTSLAATATNVASPSTTVTGTRSEASTVLVSATDGTKTVTGAVASGTGAFTATLNLSTLTDGAITVSAKATDTAGNAGSLVSTPTTKDATAPTVSDLIATDSTLAHPFSTITGTRSETATVTVTATDGATTVTGVVPSGSGAFSVVLDLSTLVDGGVTVSAVATDSAGNASPVASTSTTRSSAKSPSSITLIAPTARVTYGAAITLRGTVTRPETGTVAGAVRIEMRDDRGVTRGLRNVPISSTGAYSFVYRPAANETYTARYLGDAYNTTSASPGRRTLVAPRLTASTTTGPAGTAAVVQGNVTPNKAGATVTLYRVSSTGALAALARTTVTSTGSYRFSVRLTRGSQTLQVGIGATSGNAAGSIRVVATRT